MQDSCHNKKEEEIQSFEDIEDTKNNDALKTVNGPKSSGSTQMDSAGGSRLLIDKDVTLEIWAKLLSSVLNRLSTIKERMSCLVNSKPSLKQCKHFNICHLAIPLAQMRHVQSLRN